MKRWTTSRSSDEPASIPIKTSVFKTGFDEDDLFYISDEFGAKCAHGALVERLAEYEDSGLSPEECAIYVKCQSQSVSKRELKLGKENDILHAALEKYITENGDDICEHCKNHIPCTPDDCDKYEEGSGGWINGQRVDDFEWSCKDFDYGTCDKMAGTPCDGCFRSDYSGFDLNLNTF